MQKLRHIRNLSDKQIELLRVGITNERAFAYGVDEIQRLYRLHDRKLVHVDRRAKVTARYFTTELGRAYLHARTCQPRDGDRT